MKKIILLNLMLLSTLLFSAPVFSIEEAAVSIDADILEKISKIGFNRIISQDPKKEISDVFTKLTKHSTNQDYKKLYDLYADNFITTDGFDKPTYFDMVKKTWDLYPKVNYTTTVKDIQVNGNYAIVQILETASGDAKESYGKIAEKGSLTSESFGFYYLQRIGGDWKITSTAIISETAALKYGIAKNSNITITAPSQVKSGEEYTASLNLDVPEQAFILGSISNEPIIYPQKTPEDVFRSVKKDGILERVFVSNKNNYNEYATASIGFTKAAVIDTQNIDIQITGMAFVMTRVNVINKINPTSAIKDIAAKESLEI